MSVADDDDLPNDPRALAALIRGEVRGGGDRDWLTIADGTRVPAPLSTVGPPRPRGTQVRSSRDDPVGLSAVWRQCLVRRRDSSSKSDRLRDLVGDMDVPALLAY